MSMADAVFSSFQFTAGDYDPRQEAISTNKQVDQWFEMDDSGLMELFSSVFDEENNNDTMEKKYESLRNLPPNVSDDFWNEIISEEIEENLEAKQHHHLKQKPRSFSLASCDRLMSDYGNILTMPREGNMNNTGERKLSMDEILRLAGERFIQFSTNRVDGISMFIHPYGSFLSGLSMDDTRDVELLRLLLVAGEYVGTQHFDLANKLISRCLWMASGSGSPVQRVVFYFSEALQEKINRESGRRININEKKRKPEKGLALGTNNTFLATHQGLPFSQVMQFAGIQSIIENVKTAQKIHLIDLQIRSGIQWTALMQGLAECKIQHLKITAVGTVDQRYMEETGTRLLNFANSLNLPFSFKVVYVTDMREFEESLLDIEADDTVAVYSYTMLRSMISKSDVLESVMRSITRLKPALMVVIEVEANHNSPSFVDRFIEALLFYSAFFDCLEDCMERNSEYRRILEETYFGEGIVNIVAADGQERITRNIKLDVWRAFFKRFGMIEIELSESSKYQASLVVKQFAQGSSCTLECNGKGLTVGWKGTPLHSLTAWKFS
ncbi:hypothetical protein CDL12_11749 [Handroanthus impetiginosus]|uniref:Uncharacterized protein n=1 Tax=Handroanthus impetiginosus TaxID=429701 RepID=A0A2G9HDJ7_9LAMI|nr:hypothetical protein CDL12_11749 [Handroanthus impetiginosus]